jgi:hypothetical protein
MKTAPKVALVVMLGFVALTASVRAQSDQEPAPSPQTVASPGIIVMPPRLLPPISVPGQQAPVGNQAPHTCPTNDQKLELIG